MNKCRWFGHKWLIVYICKKDKWKFISCYCERCRLGYKDILDFVNKNEPVINTYNQEYFTDAHALILTHRIPKPAPDGCIKCGQKWIHHDPEKCKPAPKPQIEELEYGTIFYDCKEDIPTAYEWCLWKLRYKVNEIIKVINAGGER